MTISEGDLTKTGVGDVITTDQKARDEGGRFGPL